MFLVVSIIPPAILGTVAINQLYIAKTATFEVTENYLPSIINLNNAELALMHIIEAQKNHIIAPDDATMRALENKIKAQQQILTKALAGFEITLDEGKETEAFKKFQHILDDFLRLNNQVILLSQKNEDDKAQTLSVGKANDMFQETFALMEIMLETNVVGSENAKIAANTAAHTGVMLTLIVSIVAMIIVIMLAILIANSIAKPILVITKAARKLATDDATLTGIDTTELDKIIIRQDEIGDIGRAYDTLARYFKALSEDVVQVSQGLAAGNLRVTPKAEYKGDFIQVKNALEMALANLRLVIEDIVQVSQGLAAGNLRVMPQAEYSGDFIQIKNALETALSDLLQVIEDIVQVSPGLADGSSQHVSAKAEYRGDFIQIKNALETAAVKLTEAMGQNAIQNWIKTGQTQLNEQISGEQDVMTLAKNIITFLTTYLESPVGVFYLLEEEAEGEERNIGENVSLKLLASYAYTQRKGISNKFKLGEGLVGQAALEKQTLIINDLPEDYICVQSGLGEAVPKQLLVMPFMYENAVKGVIEIGSFYEMTDVQLEWLAQVMPNIGIAVNTANSRTQMQALLQRTNVTV
jgi:methyl-accepting chemotaxis protein/putative methionine-R-sulfoxide reductase with GAF domain